MVSFCLHTSTLTSKKKLDSRSVCFLRVFTTFFTISNIKWHVFPAYRARFWASCSFTRGQLSNLTSFVYWGGCLSHLAQLVHTEMYTVQRFTGHESTRVYRKCLKVWLPMIHRFKMRKALHNVAVALIYGKPPGHPMFRRHTDKCIAWLQVTKDRILGRPNNNPRALRALLTRQNFWMNG